MEELLPMMIPTAQNPRARNKLGPEQKFRNLNPTMADREAGLVDLELDFNCVRVFAHQPN